MRYSLDLKIFLFKKIAILLNKKARTTNVTRLTGILSRQSESTCGVSKSLVIGAVNKAAKITDVMRITLFVFINSFLDVIRITPFLLRY